MSTHIGAEPGQIAPTVLLPGDPLRARWIAETFLKGATCYTEVRGMYGYTGTWQGHPISVQGSGMGQPSMAIYVNELFREYDVQQVIRVGSCGALTERVGVRDLIIASGACTDSSMNRLRFHGLDYAPALDRNAAAIVFPVPFAVIAALAAAGVACGGWKKSPMLWGAVLATASGAKLLAIDGPPLPDAIPTRDVDAIAGAIGERDQDAGAPVAHPADDAPIALFRTSGTTRARPVATTMPVTPSPRAYLFRSMSSCDNPTAASVRRRPVDSSSSTSVPRCICSRSEMSCMIRAKTSRKSSDELRI